MADFNICKVKVIRLMLHYSPISKIIYFCSKA